MGGSSSPFGRYRPHGRRAAVRGVGGRAGKTARALVALAAVGMLIAGEVAVALWASVSGATPASGVSYVYDELGRLVAVVDPASDTATYSYDAVGNLVSISRQSSSVVSILEFAPNGGREGDTVRISGTWPGVRRPRVLDSAMPSSVIP